jgi:hypothetical protein
MLEFFLYFVVFLLFETFGLYFAMLNLWTNITLFTLVLLRPLRGVIFIAVFFTLFYPLSLCHKKGESFYFWTENVFPNRSSDFCPRMAKGGVC